MSEPIVDPTVLERVRGWRPYVEAKYGFRNHWYPAMFSSELAEDKPVEIMLLGESILLTASTASHMPSGTGACTVA